jgi:hypothetical protein
MRTENTLLTAALDYATKCDQGGLNRVLALFPNCESRPKRQNHVALGQQHRDRTLPSFELVPRALGSSVCAITQQADHSTQSNANPEEIPVTAAAVTHTPSVTASPASTPDLQSARNETTCACMQYLLAGDEKAKRDAFEHLKAIMLTATRGLFIPESVSCDGTTAKYNFVTDFLWTELKPYEGKSCADIEAAAADNKFRYLGRRCRQRVINEIRNVTRANKRMRSVTYNDAYLAHQATDRRPPLQPHEYSEIVAACDFLDPANADVVNELFDLRDRDRGQWAAELARSRGVSVQTARKYIRNIEANFRAALNAGHKAAKKLFDTLAQYIQTAPLQTGKSELGHSVQLDNENGKSIQFDPGIPRRGPRLSRSIDDINWASLFLAGTKQTNYRHLEYATPCTNE